MSLLLRAGLLALLVSSPAFAGDGFVVVGAKVFDGERVLDHAVVVVGDDGTITSVLENTPYNPPPGLAIVDGKGCTLLPGLIDAHAHPQELRHLQQALAFGVTTELSMLEDPKFSADVRARQAKGELVDHAKLFGAGNPVTVPGGHGTQFGPVATVSEPGQMDAFVAKRVEEGSDYIKVMLEGGEVVGREMPTLSDAALRAAVAAAHTHERLAVVHVSTMAAGMQAFAAGADGLVHVWLDEVPTAEDLGAGGARGRPFVVPTLAVHESLCRAPGEVIPLLEVEAFQPYLGPAERTHLTRAWFGGDPVKGSGMDVAKRSVAALHAAGFPILAGADSPNVGVLNGASLHRELELLVEAGLTPIEALQAATSNVAEAFSLTGRGRVIAGARADLLLVRGDPTATITDTREIVTVWRDGVAFDRAAYAEVAVAGEVARLAKIPAPPNLLDGPIADFEAGNARPRVGSIMPSTDVIRGGSSALKVEVAADASEGSEHCLRLEGTVTDKATFCWAAALWSPGFPTMPANLSAAKGLRFRARGEGPIFLGVMAQRLGPVPIVRKLDVGDDWREFSFTWEDLGGLDGTDVSGLMLGADKPGDFWLELDDLRLE